MQIRGQNNGKSVWKSRYVGVSLLGKVMFTENGGKGLAGKNDDKGLAGRIMPEHMEGKVAGNCG
jgi:hypothetical protein